LDNKHFTIVFYVMKKTSKYNNVKTEVDGIIFDSKKEAARYSKLKDGMAAGEISTLELQKDFSIFINEIKICKYLCDFYYFNTRTGLWVVEDVKGYKTPLYRLKKKLVEASWGVKIVEI
jgi:hypothetical protein